MERYKERIDRIVSEELGTFVDMALAIAANPELGGEEFKTSAMLAEALRSRGWAVETPYAGLPTAFNAVAPHRGAGPVLSLMAEYDALPEVGHACGHNLNGVMSLLAGIALARAVGEDDADKIPCEIRVVGTPAEETNGAKVEMSEKGVFDGVDLAMMAHASSGLTKPLYRSLALVPVEFDFKGRSSHAASAPWDGLNALNGLQILFHSLDMLRQHVKPDTRIHGVISKGGEAPNVVPDFAQGRFYFRSPSRGYLDTVLAKAYDCARGAALCTGTEVSWRHHETSFREVRPNPAVEALAMEALDEMGIPYSKEPHAGGSTDVGDVSWRCPAMHLSFSFI
ncbi:MAG: M20 family metallopeptidase, partial [Synergistaceae bacterium]|nr:M20 family metallopeptidase [Synergistaceae bacterium]